MKKQKQDTEAQLKAIKPEKYHWKRSYTFVLIANAAYVLFFYVLMTLFS